MTRPVETPSTRHAAASPESGAARPAVGLPARAMARGRPARPLRSAGPAEGPVAGAARPDVAVHVCRNSLPDGCRLPRQWQQDGAHVVVQMVPCSGKTSCQYLMHAIEGGLRGVCVVACPAGKCRRAQGNSRAEVRIRTLQRLLSEIGLEAERVALLRPSPGDTAERFEESVRAAVGRICALGASPLHASGASSG